MELNPSSKSNKKAANQSSLLCCKLFISESRNSAILEAIETAARRFPETVIVSKFPDRAYNRIRYTMVSYVVPLDSTGSAIYSPLRQTVLAMAEAAYGAISLDQHSGTHPRLGVVDEIVFHPLARASMDEAACLSKALAADFAALFQVPVFLFGAAHPTGKALDTIRRELGYYRPNFTGSQWAGWTLPETLSLIPEEGPTHVSRTRGIAMVGARQWVGLYNVPIMSTDVSAARRIARMVSARGGGLPTVQTLGLVHGEDSTEIACMLLEPNQIGADQVQNRVESLANQQGLDVEKGYFTDFSPEMIVERYTNLISGNHRE
ncbi:Glutamate formimidoyltransferase [Linum perenne]